MTSPTWTRGPVRMRRPRTKVTWSTSSLRKVLGLAGRSRRRACLRLRGWRIMSSAQSSRRGIRVSHSMLSTLAGPLSLPILPSKRQEAFPRRPFVRSRFRPARLAVFRLFPGEGSGRVSDPRQAGPRARDLHGAWFVPAPPFGFPLASVGARAGESGRTGWSAERSHPVRPHPGEPCIAWRRGAVFESAVDPSGRAAAPRSPAPFRFRRAKPVPP